MSDGPFYPFRLAGVQGGGYTAGMVEEHAAARRGDWWVDEWSLGDHIHIAPPPNWQVAVVLAFFVLPATIGEGFLCWLLFHPGKVTWGPFLATLMWSGFGAFVWWLFLGACGFARETVWCDRTNLFVRHSIFGYGNTRSYLLAHMGPLGLPKPDAPAASRPQSGGGLAVISGDGPLRLAAWMASKKGGVAFQYAGEDVVMGAGLDTSRSLRLAEALSSRFGLRLASDPE